MRLSFPAAVEGGLTRAPESLSLLSTPPTEASVSLGGFYREGPGLSQRLPSLGSVISQSSALSWASNGQDENSDIQ